MREFPPSAHGWQQAMMRQSCHTVLCLADQTNFLLSRLQSVTFQGQTRSRGKQKVQLSSAAASRAGRLFEPSDARSEAYPGPEEVRRLRNAPEPPVAFSIQMRGQRSARSSGRRFEPGGRSSTPLLEKHETFDSDLSTCTFAFPKFLNPSIQLFRRHVLAKKDVLNADRLTPLCQHAL